MGEPHWDTVKHGRFPLKIKISRFSLVNAETAAERAGKRNFTNFLVFFHAILLLFEKMCQKLIFGRLNDAKNGENGRKSGF